MDTETKDTDLTEKGPGGFRRDGSYIVGVSVACEAGKWYLPMRHASGGNMAEGPEKVLSWCKEMLGGPQPKVGANLLYDMEMLDCEGVTLGGNLYDVLTAEALLDEWRFRYDLDSVARTHLGRGKDEKGLQEAANAFGVDPKAGLHLLPAGHVGPYAIEDAVLARELLPVQWKKLQKEGLIPCYQLECKLLRVLLEMRRRGVRVDLTKAEQLRDQLLREEAELQRKLDQFTNLRTDVWSSKDLIRLCVAEGIHFPKTSKGNASFEAEWLKTQRSQALQWVVQIRDKSKLRRDFVEGQVLKFAACIDSQTNTGWIRPTFKPLKDDDGGARFGRFGCQKPNVQQTDPDIRHLFIPEEGEIFGEADYSAQEPRYQDHLAILHKVKGWQLVDQAYKNNRNLDRHQWVADMMGMPDKRKIVKVLNLSIAYGAGLVSIMQQLQCDDEVAKNLLNRYYAAAPFVKALQYKYSDEAQSQGYIKLLYDRRCRFPFWEPAERGYFKPAPNLEEAKKLYPNKKLRRCYAHKALNRKVQGSCAYQTKKAMIDAFEAGIIPTLQVHDALAGSFKNPEQAQELSRIMESAVQLLVPTVVGVKTGAHWGETK